LIVLGMEQIPNSSSGLVSITVLVPLSFEIRCANS
jgi:hypothetical protein